MIFRIDGIPSTPPPPPPPPQNTHTLNIWGDRIISIQHVQYRAYWLLGSSPSRRWRWDTIEGACIPCHFAHHWGAYSVLLSHDCWDNAGDQPSQPSSLLTKPSPVNQIVLVDIVILSYAFHVWTMYLYWDYLKFVLERRALRHVQGRFYLVGSLLLCDNLQKLFFFHC